jgi:hypothetical protein
VDSLKLEEIEKLFFFFFFFFFSKQDMDNKISEKDLANLLTQLGRVNGDKDRIRLINAASDGHSFDCSQIKRVVEKA